MIVSTLRVRKVKTTRNRIGTVKATVRWGLCPRQATRCVEIVLDVELGTYVNVLTFPVALDGSPVLTASCLRSRY